ncbi:hypothetical protein PIIN_11290 [Serendipita indica DSM 11827]|uniref:Uncharacterized protein n=1 Tax=Serendipita indica (strain DSM 11827) TaxID=1109443 RepID=G4U170_SERID|nr:hypothetical protein PIIN_11290 [Serendipita indica DSM 11827]
MLLPKENYRPLAHHGTEDMSSYQDNAEAEAILTPPFRVAPRTRDTPHRIASHQHHLHV